MIALPANTRIWIAAGITDLSRNFAGLSAMVQTALNEQPFSEHLFVFRGRRVHRSKTCRWSEVTSSTGTRGRICMAALLPC